MFISLAATRNPILDMIHFFCAQVVIPARALREVDEVAHVCIITIYNLIKKRNKIEA